MDATAFPHPSPGRLGEELAIDVFTAGPPDADAVLVIVSGTHGVEGYAGSALQRWWLDERADCPTRRPCVSRSCTRSTRSGSRGCGGSTRTTSTSTATSSTGRRRPGTRRTATSPTCSFRPTWDEANAGVDDERAAGGRRRRRARPIPGDRQRRPVRPSDRHLPRRIAPGLVPPLDRPAICPRSSATRDALGVIDLHTGLGPWGHGELISHEASGDPGYDRGTAWWGEVRSMRDGESVSASLEGDWLAAVERVDARRRGDVGGARVRHRRHHLGAAVAARRRVAPRPRRSDRSTRPRRFARRFAPRSPTTTRRGSPTLIERFDHVATHALAALSVTPRVTPRVRPRM